MNVLVFFCGFSCQSFGCNNRNPPILLSNSRLSSHAMHYAETQATKDQRPPQRALSISPRYFLVNFEASGRTFLLLLLVLPSMILGWKMREREIREERGIEKG